MRQLSCFRGIRRRFTETMGWLAPKVRVLVRSVRLYEFGVAVFDAELRVLKKPLWNSSVAPSTSIAFLRLRDES